MGYDSINILQQKDNEIKRLREELESVPSSRSWRIKAPLRWISRKIETKRRAVRKWMAENRDSIMQFYFSLPLPMNLKKRVADAIEKKTRKRKSGSKGSV